MKPISDAASKSGLSQIITCLCAWCTNTQLQTVQQSENIRGNGDSITQLNASIPDAYFIQDQQAGIMLPDIIALLWNPPRLLYCYQEKVSWHSCERWTTPIPIWLALYIHCVGRHGTCPRQHVPFTVWPLSACAKRLSLWFGQKHQGYNGAVVPAVAQGIFYGEDLLASCHCITCLSTCVQ